VQVLVCFVPYTRATGTMVVQLVQNWYYWYTAGTIAAILVLSLQRAAIGTILEQLVQVQLV